MNATFGVDAGLQLLQMVVYDRGTKAPAFAKLPVLIAKTIVNITIEYALYAHGRCT